ncbi:MAG: DNA-processing protein DprA [Phycisphaerales bacterium]|nr:MAG: DNA-processing protein DprA [Phycisphaerales bacterium]
MKHEPDTVASPTARKYLRLHLADGVGPVRLANLLKYFGSVDEILSAALSALEKVDGVGPATARAVFAARSDDRTEHEIDRAARLGLRILCLADPEYPPALARIPDPPVCLYVRGRFRPEDRGAVSVVGTRRCSHYGSEQARRFGALLAGAGFTVVSGLARGVDGCAHEGALEAGGRTIAVLANGLSEIYPPEHEPLARRVAAHGAVISETPLDAAPEQGNFPRRNRIVVGLGAGLLVVEAPKRSGALISARLATEYNREVFALPGRVDTVQSFGTNRLIRDGAALVTCLEDILEELPAVERKVVPASARTGTSPAADHRDPPMPFDATPDEQAVLDALGTEEITLDALCRACDIPVHRITTALMSLQLRGAVRQFPGDRYICRCTAEEASAICPGESA